MPLFEMAEVLLEYEGPQIVTAALVDADTRGSRKLYIGVAADDQEDLVIWILAPVKILNLGP